MDVGWKKVDEVTLALLCLTTFEDRGESHGRPAPRAFAARFNVQAG
jgi:hypothetical protein